MSRTFSVLVVEDNPDNAAVIGIALGLTAVLSAIFVTTGAEALAMLSKQKFDVVLLDPGLPDIDGGKLLRDILSADPAQVVIVVTADTRISAMEEYLELGARSVIVKPFNPLTLARDVLVHVID